MKHFVTTILIGAQYEKLPNYILPDRYAQHNSNIADGPAGLGAAIEALSKRGIKMEYFKLSRHRRRQLRARLQTQLSQYATRAAS